MCFAFSLHQLVSFHLNLQSAQEEALDITTLTTYVSYARKNIHPKLSDEAAEELTRGYVELRKAGKFAGSSKKVCPWNFIVFFCHNRSS